jgi:hypothetical protein
VGVTKQGFATQGGCHFFGQGFSNCKPRSHIEQSTKEALISGSLT